MFPPVIAASATVTILVDDINDHSPQFVQPIYRATMSESLGKGASVTSVLATDLDLGVNARLTYTLAERDREHFYINTIDATNTGVIKVFKVSHGRERHNLLTGCINFRRTGCPIINTRFLKRFQFCEVTFLAFTS